MDYDQRTVLSKLCVHLFRTPSKVNKKLLKAKEDGFKLNWDYAVNTGKRLGLEITTSLTRLPLGLCY